MCSCRKSGFDPALTDTRGFDHGTFVPLKLAFPDATIPVLQLSLLASMDAKVHCFLLCMPCFSDSLSGLWQSTQAHFARSTGKDGVSRLGMTVVPAC